MGSGHPPTLKRRAAEVMVSRPACVWLSCIFAFWIAACLQACATSGEAKSQSETTGIVVEGMVIRNELLFGVTEVMINVPITGAFAGCGNILSRSECRISFESVDYRGNPLTVSWEEYGEPQQIDEFVLEVGEELDPATPAWLEVVIFARGQAGARFIQE